MNGQQNGGLEIETDDDRKLFIGGLPPECKEENIREYFGKFGELEQVNLKMDQATGRSRGFAFVVFKDLDSFNNANNCAEHTILGKKVEPKKAKAKPGKVFVGGVKPSMTDDDIKAYFQQFGTVTQAEFPYDKTKSQRKPFCFITFEHEAVAKKLLTDKSIQHSIQGEELELKKVTPKEGGPMGMMGGMRGGPRGGMRGGPRGGRGGARGGWGGGAGGGWGGDQSYGGYGDGYSSGYGGDYSGYGSYDNYGYSGNGYGGGYGDYSGYGGGYGGGQAAGYGGGYGGGAPGKQRGGSRGSARHQPY